jgi:hypothetical protein
VQVFVLGHNRFVSRGPAGVAELFYYAFEEESESRSLAITSCPFATAECRSRKPLPLVAATLWNPVTRKEVQPLEGNINWVEAVARICDFFVIGIVSILELA